MHFIGVFRYSGRAYMQFFSKIKVVLLKHFMSLSWYTLLLALLIYLGSSWLLLNFAGEKDLVAHTDFIYWMLVTASTVGYGDLSPTTVAGKYIVALYVIPFGLSLFALVVGRIASFFSYQWRKGIRGLKTVNCENHILVIGWNESRTLHLLKLLQRDLTSGSGQSVKDNLVLCVKSDIENPMPDDIGFVKVMSFTEDTDMERAAVAKAKSIIIDNQDDDVTMTTALYCSAQNPDAHIIAYFKQDGLDKLLKAHCPNIECMPSVAVEMLAKSAVDPGSSALHHELLDVEKGMTQYAIVYRGDKPIKVGDIFTKFKQTYQATLIGLAPQGNKSDLALNPDLEQSVQSGDRLYYIADERIMGVDWDQIAS